MNIFHLDFIQPHLSLKFSFCMLVQIQYSIRQWHREICLFYIPSIHLSKDLYRQKNDNRMIKRNISRRYIMHYNCELTNFAERKCAPFTNEYEAYIGEYGMTYSWIKWERVSYSNELKLIIIWHHKETTLKKEIWWILKLALNNERISVIESVYSNRATWLMMESKECNFIVFYS